MGIVSSQSLLVNVSLIDAEDSDFLNDRGDFAVMDFNTAPILAFIVLFSSFFTNSTDSYTSCTIIGLARIDSSPRRNRLGERERESVRRFTAVLLFLTIPSSLISSVLGGMVLPLVVPVLLL